MESEPERLAIGRPNCQIRSTTSRWEETEMSEAGTALIMGVGDGLGLSLARRFAAGGHAIAMVSRDKDRMQPFADEITQAGGTAIAYAADTTDQDAVIATFDQAEQQLGPIDVAIHNVNGRVVKSILEMEGPEFEGQWRAVCLGGLYVGREAAKRMLPRGQGSIFFTGGRGSRGGG
jgi:NAD(P)-dependent dehydrogenase (short-subunit alcohol dehydrogenase family)